MQAYQETVDKTTELQRQTMESLQPGDSSFFNILGKPADTMESDIPSGAEPTEEQKRKELTLSILKAQGEAVHKEENRQAEEERKQMEADTVSKPMTVGDTIMKAYEDTVKSLDTTVLKGGGGEITTGTLDVAATTPVRYTPLPIK
jgi:ParB-like chromosome segregation protein Spo0J